MDTIIPTLPLPESFSGLAFVLVAFYYGYPFLRNILEKKGYWDMRERQIFMIKEHAELVKNDPNSPYIKELELVIDQISSLANRYRPLSDNELLPVWQRVAGCFAGFFGIYFLSICAIYFSVDSFSSFWQVVLTWALIGALISPSAVMIETSSIPRAIFAGVKVFGAVMAIAVISFAFGKFA